MTPLLSLLAFVTLSIGILGYLDLGPWCTVGSCGYGLSPSSSRCASLRQWGKLSLTPSQVTVVGVVVVLLAGALVSRAYFASAIRVSHTQISLIYSP
jgi:hypothetical protein